MNLLGRAGKVLLISLLTLIGLAVVLLAMLLIPLDREVKYTAMLGGIKERINSLQLPGRGKHSFTVGYSRENLTPSYLTSTAGYGNRFGKTVTSVHDSIFVRCMVVDNGFQKVAIVTADLLLMPPVVAQMLEHELPSVGFTASNTFFGATHSHNSIGNWSHGLMTVMYGDYDAELVDHIGKTILKAIKKADANKLDATIEAAHLPVANAVRNRINRDNPVDSLLRVIRIVRRDSSKLLLLNFTAHATCLSDGNNVLSADYPGRLTQMLEQSGYSFAMFMAGAVGSHAGKTKEREWPCVEEMSAKLSEVVSQNPASLRPVNDTTLWMGRVQLEMNEPQFKLFRHLRLRPFAFNNLMGDFPEYVTGLRIGNLLMLGTPCDFSGEFYPALDSAAAANGLQMMVTSFNGGYIGYVTPTKYYDIDHYETQLMNWYGPGTGEYLTECMEMLIEHAAQGRPVIDAKAVKEMRK